jgi:hypothetical protein
MSEYDAFAADYDVWAAEMTEDGGSYLDLGQPFDRQSLEYVYVAKKP